MSLPLQRIVEVLYVFAPLLLAAALSGLVMRQHWLEWLRRPIDAGYRVRGKRVFGDSKTWRGVVIAVVGCMLGLAIQKYAIGAAASGIAVLDYAHLDVVRFGAAMGAAAMAGELPNSFVKRQLDIAPGKTTRGWLAVVFYVWDQVDLLTFVWPVLARELQPDPGLVVASIGVALVLHPLSSLIGYIIGARRSAR